MCGIYGITANDPGFIENYLQLCKQKIRRIEE